MPKGVVFVTVCFEGFFFFRYIMIVETIAMSKIIATIKLIDTLVKGIALT